MIDEVQMRKCSKRKLGRHSETRWYFTAKEGLAGSGTFKRQEIVLHHFKLIGDTCLFVLLKIYRVVYQNISILQCRKGTNDRYVTRLVVDRA